MPESFFERFTDRLRGRPPPIKVGMIASQIGPLDYYGAMQERGFRLGIAYATDGSWQIADRDIELLVEDDAGDPATGGQKARALIEQEGVDILQGATSSAVTIVLAGIAQEYGRLLMVDPAAADSITGTHFNRYVFRTGANVSQDAAAGGKYAVQHLGKSFCYLAPDYIFGRQSNAAWKRVIEEHGGETIAEYLVPPNTTDFQPVLRQCLEAHADVLVQSWAGRGYGNLFDDMRDVGIFDNMVVTGGLGDREARHALGLNAVGMVGICKYSPILPDNPINDWLIAKHIEQYGHNPDLFTGGGFSAGVALVEGLKRTEGNPDTEGLISILEGMTFAGPKGTYSFRVEDHQALQPMYVVEMVPDPDGQPWAIPRLTREMTLEETAPPVVNQEE